MPGPKMGPRPPDFDEPLVRQSPTFLKWSQLNVGESLRYACREFLKGHGDDEERLMRRIMIARRNNLRDHQTLKRARQITNHDEITSAANDDSVAKLEEPASKIAKRNGKSSDGSGAGISLDSAHTQSGDAEIMIKSVTTPATRVRKRRPSTLFSDAEVAKEMDVQAVESTRSYRAWMNLEDGAVFVYNQKYVKGRDGHDWLLRKNIWRRMRYRRENKKMVERLKQQDNPTSTASEMNEIPTQQQQQQRSSIVASQIVDQTLLHHQPQDPATSVTLAAYPSDIVNSTELRRLLPGHGADASTGLGHQHSAAKLDVDNASLNEAVEAAVAAAQNFSKSAHYTNTMGSSTSHVDSTAASTPTTAAASSLVVVHNPLEGVANSAAALDAAARLAATAPLDDEAAVAAAAAAAAQQPGFGAPSTNSTTST